MLANEGMYGKAIDVDCNSMYPSILRDEWLPWGLPEQYEGKYEEDDDMPLHCDELTFRAELKPNGYPFCLTIVVSTDLIGSLQPVAISRAY